MKKPLVTISVPTFNSEKFLRKCLEAVKAQTYSNIEVNIIDGDSKDRTLDIAKELGVKQIIICKDALLKARYEGVKVAEGEYILLLDSDQILEPNAIERSIELIEAGNDMLVLGEDVYNATSFLEKLFQQDRKLVHAVKDFNPYTSVMLPRFYRASILKKAFEAIPTEVLDNVGGQDHALIYYEAWQHSQAVALVPHAVKHIEPSSIKVMVKKFYRWGYSSEAAHHPRYEELLSKKERFRKGIFTRGLVTASFASILLLLIKGVPYYAGLTRKKMSKA